MKRTMFAAVIAATLLPMAAHAVDFEVGAGVASYKPVGNMMWYQEGFPYKLDLRNVAAQAGMTDTLWQSGRYGIDWHAGYVYLGSVKSDAIATSDENYSLDTKSCIGVCEYRSRFVGSGNVHGIKLTVEPHYTYNGLRFGIEGGAFIYRAQWHITLHNRPVELGYAETGAVTVRHSPKVQLGAVVGASISRGNWTVRYQRFFDKPRSDEPNGDFPVIWKHTDMVSLHYRF